MAEYKAPVRDYKFIFEDLLNIEQYKDVEGFEDMLTNADDMLEMTGQFCEEVLLPLNRIGDEQGVKYDPTDQSVTLPEGFNEAYAQYCETGFPTFNADPAYGGLGLPNLMQSAVSEMISSGNMAFGLLPGLSHGAYSAIHEWGNDELKDVYLPKMVTGEWSGAMALTEADHGTDLPGLKTKAVPTEDGKYKITGEKIFISCGEQDATENNVHLVLAKMPDAPEGTPEDQIPPGAGEVSLFLVPKFKVSHETGEMEERNGFAATGVEHKMGIHASPTCTIQYDEAEGYLVGEPGKGLKAMFTMMNEERLGVGAQALGLAEIARQNAVEYSKNRLQGKHVDDMFDPDAPDVPIIEHEDVRRMEYEMRAFTEGSRALAARTALMIDLAHKHPDEEEREKANAYVELMTPIVKAHLTDGGFDATDHAVQVYGGHGYIGEHGMEQFQRDARITRIYEGANGIQAKDLAMRKVISKVLLKGQSPEEVLDPVLGPIREQIAEHEGNPDMADFIEPLKAGLASLDKATESLVANAEAGTNLSNADAGSTAYLKLFSMVAVGGIMAEQAALAQEKLQGEELDDKDRQFFEAKLQTAGYHQNIVLATKHAGLAQEVDQGKKWIPPFADVEVELGRKQPAPEQEAPASNVEKYAGGGPKTPAEHAEQGGDQQIAR